MADTSQLSVAEIAAYVAEACGELRNVAKGARLRTVSYLLDMARLESEKIVEEEGRSARQPVHRPHGTHRK